MGRVGFWNICFCDWEWASFYAPPVKEKPNKISPPPVPYDLHYPLKHHSLGDPHTFKSIQKNLSWGGKNGCINGEVIMQIWISVILNVKMNVTNI